MQVADPAGRAGRRGASPRSVPAPSGPGEARLRHRPGGGGPVGRIRGDDGTWGAVQVGVPDALSTEVFDATGGALLEVVEVVELDRVGGAGLGAGRLEPALQPVVAEGALLRAPAA